jgi:biofilm protein TabA
MIIAALEYLARQTASFPAIQQGLDWLQANHAASGLPARVEIAGSDVFALVQSYQTEAAGELVEIEAHRKYIDIQYICSGVECMGWLPLASVREPGPYNPDKDVLKGHVPAADITPVLVRAGSAAIFYPEDAHAPKLASGAPAPVRKIVVKVRCA